MRRARGAGGRAPARRRRRQGSRISIVPRIARAVRHAAGAGPARGGRTQSGAGGPTPGTPLPQGECFPRTPLAASESAATNPRACVGPATRSVLGVSRIHHIRSLIRALAEPARGIGRILHPVGPRHLSPPSHPFLPPLSQKHPAHTFSLRGPPPPPTPPPFSSKNHRPTTMCRPSAAGRGPVRARCGGWVGRWGGAGSCWRRGTATTPRARRRRAPARRASSGSPARRRAGRARRGEGKAGAVGPARADLPHSTQSPLLPPPLPTSPPAPRPFLYPLRRGTGDLHPSFLQGANPHRSSPPPTHPHTFLPGGAGVPQARRPHPRQGSPTAQFDQYLISIRPVFDQDSTSCF